MTKAEKKTVRVALKTHARWTTKGGRFCWCEYPLEVGHTEECRAAVKVYYSK